MRTRCSATAHWAANARARTSSSPSKTPSRLVQDLHHPHQDALVVDERQGQHAARSIAGSLVHLAIEARIGIAIGDVDDRAIARAGADDTGAGGNAHRRNAGRDLEDQLVRRGVVKPDGAAIGVEDLLGRVDDLRQHRHQVERSRELAGDSEDRLHVRHRKAAVAWSGAHAAGMYQSRGSCAGRYGPPAFAARPARERASTDSHVRARITGCGTARAVAARDGGPAPVAYDFLWENAGKWPSSG